MLIKALHQCAELGVITVLVTRITSPVLEHLLQVCVRDNSKQQQLKTNTVWDKTSSLVFKALSHSFIYTQSFLRYLFIEVHILHLGFE